MPGRETKISAPAQGDQWFTLWPESTSHQSSHRKIMFPSNEFMQMAVHLSEVKKSHFHFKRRTHEVLNIHELTEIQKFSICTWVVSAHACCLILVEFTLNSTKDQTCKACWSKERHDYIPWNLIPSLYFLKDANEKSVDCTDKCYCNITSELKTNTPKWTTAKIMWT